MAQYTNINSMPTWMRQYVQPYMSGIGTITRPNDPYSGDRFGPVQHNGLNLQYQLIDPHHSAEVGPSPGGYYFGGLSDLITNPETGKQGAVRGYFGDDGLFQKAEWWEPKTTWIDKVLSAGPALVLGAAALGAGGFLGSGVGGSATAGGAAAPISASTPTWTAGLPEAAGAGVEAGMAGVGASSWGTAAPALSSAGGSVFDKLSGMFSGDKSLNWLPAVANMISQNRQGNYRQDIADRMLNNRQGFVDELQRTYENPQGYLDSPEYQAIAGTTLNQLMRKDAAGGRLANDAGRQKLMQDHAFNWLNDRRKTLVQAITGNPFGSDMLQQGTQGLADRYGMFNSIFDMLGVNQGRQAWSFDPQRGYVFDLGKV